MSVFEQTAKINRWLGGLLALLGALAWSQPGVAGSDLWWHLASGREIWARGWVHSTDPFSYTFGGREWLNHEWLWDVIYWAFYRVNPEAVAWLNFGIVGVIFLLSYLVAHKESGSALASVLVTWLAAAAAHWFLDIRPHLITLLFVGFFLLSRDRPWAAWLWPALVVLWANLHSGFVFGVGLIGLFVLVRAIEASLRARRLVIVWRDWGIVGLCIVAMLVNPWGYRILAYPLDYLDPDSPFRDIIEWQPPHFAFNLREFNGRYTFVLLAAMLGVPLAATRSRFLLALALVTFAMAYTSRRFIPLFAITSAPLAALALAWAKGQATRLVPQLAHPGVALASLAVGALATLYFWQEVRIAPRFLDRWTEHSLYPDAALRYLDALDPPKRLLNYYNWGGYILLHAPGPKLFIDGRANTLYDDEIYLDYQSMLGGAPGILVRVNKYPADLALVPAGGAFAQALGRGAAGWKLIYSDSVASILAPPGSPYLSRTLPARDTVLQGHPDQLIELANRAFAGKQVDTAFELVERALEVDPLLLRGYESLIRLSLARRDRTGIDRAVARGLRENPRFRSSLKRAQGQAYERLGDLEAALEAYREAIPTGPFSTPGGMQRYVEQLEHKLARSGTG